MKHRLVFIDLLRGWATLVMIEVHVVNAFTVPEVKQAAWFSVLNFINGLVAPSFLFVSGFVFIIASQRKLEEFRSFGRSFWRQLGRIGLIWCVGYLLHLPSFSFSRIVHQTTEQEWLKFYQADILHCIAFGLLLLFLTRLVVKKDRLFERLLVVYGMVPVVVAPFIWEIDFTKTLPAALAAYLNGQQYSQFPIFNWLGFMMSGAYAAVLYQRAHGSQNEPAFVRRAGWIGVALIVVGWALLEIPISVPYASGAVRANPFFVAVRLGIVLLLMLACWLYVERYRTERSFVITVSRESLLVYAAHLLVIYGQFWHGHSLAFYYGRSLTLGEALAGTILLAGAMVLLAAAWGWLKDRSLPTARVVSYATAMVALILFFVRTS